ncbi:MAG: T9SS type A sorting domain-containing protein, partial [Bacteroidota bacterium]
FDPTLAVLPSGSLRLYYSSSQGLPPPGQDSSINTYSAISADGINYTFEPNPRVDHPTRRVIDPAVVFFNGSWHYSSPVGAPQEGAYHYTSADGLSFAPRNNYPSDNTHNWTGNFLVESNTELRFYGSGARIWYSTSPDAFIWNSYVTTNVIGGDPTTVKLSPSSYLMIYVGPPYSTEVSTQEHSSPVDFLLCQNYPNPFNPVTTINYQLSTINNVALKVFDLLGREIATLVYEQESPGQHSLVFDASSLSSGVYFYRLSVGRESMTRTMQVQR